ncbi:hypothetical protein MTO96_002926 [Rhipicephalus appendiculatus]
MGESEGKWYCSALEFLQPRVMSGSFGLVLLSDPCFLIRALRECASSSAYSPRPAGAALAEARTQPSPASSPSDGAATHRRTRASMDVAIRCTRPGCGCECFTPGKGGGHRLCDSCQHGWVAHARARARRAPPLTLCIYLFARRARAAPTLIHVYNNAGRCRHGSVESYFEVVGLGLGEVD